MYYSDIEPPENIGESNITGNRGNSTDLMSVFDHKDVLSFGCLSGFRAKDKPAQGQTFHTLTCSKGEWKGVTPVCNGRQLFHSCTPMYLISYTIHITVSLTTCIESFALFNCNSQVDRI